MKHKWDTLVFHNTLYLPCKEADMDNKENIKIYVNGLIDLSLMSKNEYSIFIKNMKQIIKKYYKEKDNHPP